MQTDATGSDRFGQCCLVCAGVVRLFHSRVLELRRTYWSKSHALQAYAKTVTIAIKHVARPLRLCALCAAELPRGRLNFLTMAKRDCLTTTEKRSTNPTRNHSNQILCFLPFEPDRSSLASYLMPLRLCEHRYARADFHAKAQRKVARRKEEKLL